MQLAATYNGNCIWDNGTMGDDLLSALAWIDYYARNNEEYLVRLEKDEPIPSIYLSARKNASEANNVKFRLRGLGQERIISHNGMRAATSPMNPFTYRYSSTAVLQTLLNESSLLGVGNSTNLSGAVPVTLSLEDKVTVRGQTADSSFRKAITVFVNCRLIMEAGAKITGYDATNYSLGGLIYLYYGNVTSTNHFIMRGGEITGNIIYSNDANAQLITFPGYAAPTTNRFIKTGGIIANNVDKDGNEANIVKFTNAVTYTISPDPAITYDLPY
jgi:hypothetical protein